MKKIATLFTLIVIFSSCEKEITKPDPMFKYELQKNGNVTFTNLTKNAKTFLWNFGDGEISNEENPSHDFKKNGNYFVKFNAKNKIYEVTATILLKVDNINPIANFSFDVQSEGLVKFTNKSKNSNQFLWDFGNGRTSEEENPVISYSKNGIYKVKLYAMKDSSKDSTISEISITNISKIVVAEYDNVFVCDGTGNCILSDTKTGKERWRLNLQSGILSSPTYSNGLIFIGTRSGYTALELENGNKKWEFTTKRGNRSSPIAKDNKIFFTSSDWGSSEAILYCLNNLSGELIWETKLPFAGDSSPTIKDSKIYIGSTKGIYIIDAETGKSSDFVFKNLRFFSVNGEDSYFSSPCVNENNVYYCFNGDNYKDKSKVSQLIGYNVISKSQTKLFDLSPMTISSPTFVENCIIINNKERLVKFDITKMRNNWLFSFPKSNSNYAFDFDASPTFFQNSIYAVGNGVLFSIDLSSGKEIWRFGEDILTSPVFFNNMVYVSSLNKLIALDSKKGNLLWSIPIKNNGWTIEPSVIVINSNGNVFHSGISGEHQ